MHKLRQIVVAALAVTSVVGIILTILFVEAGSPAPCKTWGSVEGLFGACVPQAASVDQ